MSQLWGFLADRWLEIMLGMTGFFGGTAFAIYTMFKGISFLGYYHHGSLTGAVRVLPRVALLLRKCGVIPFVTGQSKFLHAARGLTEFEIFHPKPQRPRDLSGDKAHREAAIARWRDDRKSWRRDCADFIAKMVAYEHRDASRDLTRATLEAKMPMVVIDNIARIDTSRDAIRRYFDTVYLVQGESNQPPRELFISYVKLKRGFMAPLFLITGLMTRFSDDWSGIIDSYSNQFDEQKREADALPSRALRELQAFEFNCWLLWGPSVPLCTCDRWKCTVQESNGKRPIFYQYGFGDENNSIDVLIDNGRGEFVEAVRDNMRGAILPEEVYAKPVVLTAQIGTRLSSEHVCQSQQSIAQTDARSRVYLVKDYVEDAQPAETQSQYYSAYLWVMFFITDRDGNEFWPAQRWRNLLPFFEHGNLADAATLEALKEALVVKACAALERVLSRDPNIRIHYACAIDESNCGEPLLFPVPDPHNIAARLERRIEASEALKTARDGGRITLQRHQRTDFRRRGADGLLLPINPFAACHLPAVVDAFIAHASKGGALTSQDIAKV